MAIDAVCPDCGSSYKLADGSQGKKVRCKKCGCAFPVGNGPAPRRTEENDTVALDDESAGRRAALRADSPARRRRDVDEGEDRPRARRRSRRDEDEDLDREKGNSLALPLVLLGGGVLVVILVVGGIFLFARNRNAGRNAEVAGANQQAPNQPGQQPAVPFPVQPGPNRPAGRKTPGGLPEKPAAARQTVWKVTADPAPADLVLDKVPTLQLPVPVGSEVIFPTSPSPFVAIGRNVTNADSRVLYDLREGKAVGSLRGKLHGFSTSAVSPDGAYFAAVNPTNLRTVDVWSFKDGQGAGRINVNQIGFMHFMDFGAPGQLVTVVTGAMSRHTIQVWDVHSGQKMREIPGTRSLGGGDAFSPGRRYLARFADNTFQVWDLTTGEGSDLDLLGGINVCVGLAFSTDGTMLAGCFQGAGDGRIVMIDVARGQITAQHSFPQPLNLMVPNAFSYKGPALQWLPDNSGWLVYGDTVVDRTTGKAGFSLSAQVTGMQMGPRRLVSKSQALVVAGKGFNHALVTVPIKAGDLDAGAVAGGEVRPPARPGDWSAARDLRAAAGNGVGAPDPAGTLRGKPALPLAVAEKGETPVRLSFTKPEVAKVVVVSAAASKNKFNPRTWRADRYDLLTGKRDGGVDVVAQVAQTLSMPGLAFADASPEGDRLVVRDLQDAGRLDVWSLDDGKPLAAWWPYAKGANEKTPGTTVTWAEFADSAHLWTLSDAGKLALWSVPEGKALASLDGVQGPPVRSTGGKQLAAFTGGSFALFDALTGEAAGRFDPPSGGSARRAPAAAFRRDGKELAALLEGLDAGGRLTLVRWDVPGGKVVGEFPVGVMRSTDFGLEWCGDKHLLAGGTDLIDLDAKQATWRYRGASHKAQRSPDGRKWFTQQKSLAARALPDEAARQLGASLKGAEPIIQAGGTVDLRLDAEGTVPDLAGLRQRMTEGVTQRLRSAGLGVGAGGSQLTVQVRESDTGEKMQLELFGGRAGRKAVDVPVKKLTCQAVLTDPQGGGVIWKSDTTFTTRTFFGIRTFEGEPAAVFQKELWNSAVGWAGGLHLPSNVVRLNGRVVTLPVEGPLNADK